MEKELQIIDKVWKEIKARRIENMKYYKGKGDDENLADERICLAVTRDTLNAVIMELTHNKQYLEEIDYFKLV